MATSSIFANFDITDSQKAHAFVDALEKSAMNPAPKHKRKSRLVTDLKQVKDVFKSLKNEN